MDENGNRIKRLESDAGCSALSLTGAYLLACYLLAAFAIGDAGFRSVWWVVLAPITVPLFVIVSSVFIGNPELPISTVDWLMVVTMFAGLNILLMTLVIWIGIRPHRMWSATALSAVAVTCAKWLLG